MAEQSNASAHLWLLAGLEDFRHYSLELLAHNRRTLAILSRDLDSMVYGTNEFADTLSGFARSSRHVQIQILLQNTEPAIATNHALIRLAQRLSTKILVRKMTIEPQNTDMGFMLGDTDKLLYKNDETVYRGFFNSEATLEVKQLREEFNYLWQYAEPEPEFQLLHI